MNSCSIRPIVRRSHVGVDRDKVSDSPAADTIPAIRLRSNGHGAFGSYALVAAVLGGALGTALLAQTPRASNPNVSRPAAQQGQPVNGAAGGNDAAQPAIGGDVDDGHPLRPALKLAYTSRDVLKDVNFYTAQFSKQERIGNRLIKQRMTMKIREEPFGVYLNFQGMEAGREVLFPAPNNPNHLLVHAEGVKAIAGTMSLAMTDPEVTKENRYPISNIGMRQMLASIIASWEAETKFGEIKVDFYPGAKLGSTPCTVVQTMHPQPRRQFRFHLTRVYFDKQTNMPIRVENYGWPRNAGEQPPLIEEYTFSNLNTKVQFTDLDFDPRNRSYRF